MRNVNQQEFVQLAKNDDHVIVDVRRPNECATGMIPKAISIDLMNHDLFKTETLKLDKSKAYLVYCRSGNRSGKACQIMDEMGFETTYNLMGGMMDWRGEVV